METIPRETTKVRVAVLYKKWIGRLSAIPSQQLSHNCLLKEELQAAHFRPKMYTFARIVASQYLVLGLVESDVYISGMVFKEAEQMLFSISISDILTQKHAFEAATFVLRRSPDLHCHYELARSLDAAILLSMLPICAL